MTGEKYNYDELKAVGVLGGTGSPETPRVYCPIVACSEADVVILPPFEQGDGVIQVTQDTEVLKREMFDMLLDQTKESGFRDDPFEANMFEHPEDFRPDSCVYITPGSGDMEYITVTEAHKRITSFADQHRQEGDEHLRQGRKEKAEMSYNRAASASQEAEDYARLIMCGLAMPREQRLKAFIVKQGHDPDKLVERIRSSLQPE